MSKELISEKFPQYDDAGRELVRRAYLIAARALEGEVRSNGHDFIEHPLNVALIASDEIGLTADCIAAVFLHEATRKHPELDLRKGELCGMSLAGFPEDVYTMVDGLNKIAKIKPKDTRLEAENYKKLIVQYSTDPRVTVLKLADRLEVMRNLDSFPKSSRENKILETLMLYIPLAHQLGLYNLKSEMEDIYFRFAEPEQYRAITNKLKATEGDRRRLTDEFIEPLKLRLSGEGIRYKLKIRTKAAYSIWKKMVKQKVPFEGVYDVFAIRFIIDCEPDSKVEKDLCWKVYSYVTEEYEPDTSRLRDWVTNPKPNGYESLHITVKNRSGASIEVQIRTRRMDDEAENGSASHWSYKGIKHEEHLDRWLKSVRYALEHPHEGNSDDLPQPPSKEIFVFTPSGELRILSAGASVLDFAFNIHSGLGVRCTGARVNGKAVSFREKLHTGDVIDVMTSKNQKPTSDWLNYVVTSKARNRIKQELNEEEFKKAAQGKELLGRRLKNWKLELPDDVLADFLKRKKYSTINSFYAAVSDGIIDVNEVKNFILEHDSIVAQAIEAARASDAEKHADKMKQWDVSQGADDILVINARDLKGLEYKMAQCCHPVFGDDVFGFVTRTEGIKIHRISCPNAARLIESYPYRIQKVKWADSPAGGTFQSSLKIIAAMESSVIGQITEVVSSFRASLRSFNVNENDRNGTYEISMKIHVPSNMELDKVISQLKTLRHVMRVNRV
ncbi:MAG: HD domain-containing protein [Bacteroidales bacterium]|uniref:RelA/SpoT family protein n=1 Tax=Candidatus Cryptobacteroides sp. TaxID=2952915 RepID=UPI002A7526DB|nr:HD domain-containing protein [Candidatus Cryptobacteroides sp.]MDD5914919.1 HD domain-containing protein [Bacteroidales bacterium]MDD7235001.1 HD domain-containing protein [Bacteroidales bacterium]MDY2701424.1 HD domain-containing protein [Candidatus Cryptobacteroides sp.]